MSLDLNKLANKLDEALSNETTETLTKFLTDKRMSNNKQSSIDLFIDQLEEKGNAYEENEGVRTINISIDISDYMELKIQAKAMHKDEMVDFGNDLLAQNDTNYIGLPNLAEHYYNETFGQ